MLDDGYIYEEVELLEVLRKISFTTGGYEHHAHNRHFFDELEIKE